MKNSYSVCCLWACWSVLQIVSGNVVILRMKVILTGVAGTILNVWNMTMSQILIIQESMSTAVPLVKKDGFHNGPTTILVATEMGFPAKYCSCVLQTVRVNLRFA